MFPEIPTFPSVSLRSPAHVRTCAPHLATHTHTQRLHPPPWLWSHRLWGQLGGFQALPSRSHLCAPAGQRPGVPGPRPAEKGAVITRPRGAPPPRAFHPGPRPFPTQTLIIASCLVISLGPGGPGGQTGMGGRGAVPRIVSIATPSSGVGCSVNQRSGWSGLVWGCSRHPASSRIYERHLRCRPARSGRRHQ